MENTDYQTLPIFTGKIKHSWFWALCSGFGSKGEVPCVTWYFSGWGGGLQGDGGLVWSGGGRCFLCGVGLSGEVRTEVGQRQGNSSHVVDSQQDLQGADLLEALIGQGLTGPLNLLDAWRERTYPASCRRGKNFRWTANILFF